jgi:hypothetical protein
MLVFTTRFALAATEGRPRYRADAHVHRAAQIPVHDSRRLGSSVGLRPRVGGAARYCTLAIIDHGSQT